MVWLGYPRIYQTQNEYPFSVNSMTVVPSNGMTKYKLHLPTYNGVVNLKIGVDENAVIERYDDQKTKKILWYGTSITREGLIETGSNIHKHHLT